MKKVIILSYLIGLIGFHFFTRENAAGNFFGPESRNASMALFRPLKAFLPNTAQSEAVKDLKIREINDPSSSTLGITMDKGEINFIRQLDRHESETRDSGPGYVHFAFNKVSKKWVDKKFDSIRIMQ
jgi:hypothetical protein